MTVDAVLSSEKGLIVAPAGCGKTHLITETLNIAKQRPYLVLTHTTAGVAALKQRLRHLGVSNKNYIVATIDGWARHISNIFPVSCNVTATPENPKVFYPQLRRQVNRYLVSGSISELISSSYSQILVDEYQDCNLDQHAIIYTLSEILPTIVFGDPLQCIFNFGGPMPSWTDDVESRFPLLLELNTPWRWINAGAQGLGEWILHSRGLLLQGGAVDLQSYPEYVHWQQLSGNYQTDSTNQIRTQYQIRQSGANKDSLLVIGNPIHPAPRHKFASASIGIDVVEPVELADITSLATDIDKLCGMELITRMLDSLSSMMTGIGKANLIKRTQTILAGRNIKQPSQIELAASYVVATGSKESIANLLSALEQSTDTRVFRTGAFSALKDTILLSVSDPAKTTKQAAEVVREQRRHLGDRRIPRCAIGSTLLLKGLEADHVLILDAGEMNHNNLYVALSRGAKSITVFSGSNNVP
ncbi:MAG: UvrD-helicase domain-containing protein [Candidatus Thiodiazotropha endolucinida]